MKTKIISKLKKELLLVELPEDTQFDVLVNNPLWKDGIKFLTGTDEKFHFIKGSYTLLGSPDEINEEDVIELVDNKGNYYKNYSPIHGSVQGNITFNALESFHSALESEIYWDVNPLGKEEPKCIRYGTSPERIKNLEWREAELRTFDRNRTLIFVKN